MHTPGPWKLDGFSIMAQFEGQEVQIASMSRTSWSQPDGGKNRRLIKQNEANGPLMVTAPDLLALVEAVEFDGAGFCLWCNDLGRHTADCPRQQTLARATGTEGRKDGMA